MRGSQYVLYGFITLLLALPVQAGQKPVQTDAAKLMTLVEIDSGEQKWTAKIGDDAPSRDFLAMLPLELTLEDYASTEKIAQLPRRLDTVGTPKAITPQVGDVTFYAPWGNLAIFYKDGRSSPGLVRLGRIEADAASLGHAGIGKVVIRRLSRR